MKARSALGGVYGYYRLNYGSQKGLEFWEDHLAKKANELNVHDLFDLFNGFDYNRTLHRSHFKEKIES